MTNTEFVNQIRAISGLLFQGKLSRITALERILMALMQVNEPRKAKQNKILMIGNETLINNLNLSKPKGY